ncbi:ECF RNA polymerase sigma factor SigH [Aquisphaera giovannonii]|uniref:ECF RNA polymerase sigma factor SigH n=1 Tax=Aquisphaera giovannonii TaxID=406548 RepID=A0A5B9WDJ2_9BACT|nr:sigma-70 family RNA polymerase sigma factor [Aquisphaera giovannonii]QEH38587.1 ECF RNA polymerase sigma factor SigH [Aquisphaera giovannonii]
MATAGGEPKGWARDLDLIAGSGGAVGLSDAELLGRFARGRGAEPAAEAAFETLVAKHGPMVLGVCRGVLGQAADADDAFQATFLVLVRKAGSGSVRVGDSLGPWLYGVARRVALKARAASRKRRGREAPAEAASDASRDRDGIDVEALDARPILYEELDRLPEKYRSPVVLCHLEGLSHEEAARRLDWPVGTVSGRLSRARDLLRSRLSRRGLGVSPALEAGMFLPRLSPPVPSPLLRSTVRSASAFLAGGTLPASVLTLTRGVIAAMFVHKLKIAALAGSSLALMTVAGAYAAGQIAARPAAQGPQRDIPGLPKGATRSQDGLVVLGNPDMKRPQLSLPTLSNDSIVAVAPRDRRSVTAMVIDDGAWQEYRAPEGTTLVPIMSADVLALMYTGDDVREVAALSTSSTSMVVEKPRGTWVRQPLRQPARGEIIPVLGQGMAYYHVDSDLYAYSATTNTWDTLHLDGAEPPRIALRRSDILAEQGDTLYVFSARRGKWSKGLKVPGTEPK